MAHNNHLAAALQVFTKNPITRAFLEFNDPKGLEQARAALRGAGINPDPDVVDDNLVDGFGDEQIATNGEATIANILYRYPGVFGLFLTLKSPTTPAEWRATAASYLGDLETRLRDGSRPPSRLCLHVGRHGVECNRDRGHKGDHGVYRDGVIQTEWRNEGGR
jgi:hypothetical protein